MKLKTPIATAIVAVASLVFAALPIQSAAADTVDGAGRVGIVAAQIGGKVAELADAVPADEIDAPVDVALPSDVSSDLRLDSSYADELRVGFPLANGAGVETASGLVSFDSAPNYSTVIAPQADGSVQVANVIDNRSAPSSFDFDFSSSGHVSLVTDPTTGSVVVRSDGQPIAVVAAPWAVDAHGVDVPTHYEIRGSTLTQKVEHRGDRYAYPIVADPHTYYYWWGQALRFTKSETNAVANAAEGGNAAVASVFCGLIASAPGAVVCGIVSALVLNSVGNTFKSAKKQGRCVQVNMPFVGLIVGGPLTWQFYIVNC